MAIGLLRRVEALNDKQFVSVSRKYIPSSLINMTLSPADAWKSKVVTILKDIRSTKSQVRLVIPSYVAERLGLAKNSLVWLMLTNYDEEVVMPEAPFITRINTVMVEYGMPYVKVAINPLRQLSQIAKTDTLYVVACRKDNTACSTSAFMLNKHKNKGTHVRIGLSSQLNAKSGDQVLIHFFATKELRANANFIPI